MEIQCPNCASRFKLPESVVQYGVKLRCSVCKNVFPYSAPPSSKMPEQNAKKGVSKAKFDRKIAFFVLLLVLCLAGGFGWYFWLNRLIAATPSLPEEIAQKVARLTMRNVRQYYVDNEKVGSIMVIEGKVVNEFPRAKAMIVVEAAIYDKNKKVLSVKKQLAGTQLSLFQLQVLSEKEMESFLSNKIEILANNNNVPQGGEVLFMTLFYDPPPHVAEFGVCIADVLDAETSKK
ncbi:MAG: zinc-ribbon domain-containing protein [Desulfovibrio sp.]|jgi:predicted Zn finger-like uncharacterized protein|nr:zinc-ribbon domain-containing protein [Desulfovibrio sp.]